MEVLKHGVGPIDEEEESEIVGAQVEAVGVCPSEVQASRKLDRAGRETARSGSCGTTQGPDCQTPFSRHRSCWL